MYIVVFFHKNLWGFIEKDWCSQLTKLALEEKQNAGWNALTRHKQGLGAG